jgi:hypothetical protein
MQDHREQMCEITISLGRRMESEFTLPYVRMYDLGVHG